MRERAEGGVTVITVPPPTANGPLHVGHLSGPFLARSRGVDPSRRVNDGA